MSTMLPDGNNACCCQHLLVIDSSIRLVAHTHTHSHTLVLCPIDWFAPSSHSIRSFDHLMCQHDNLNTPGSVHTQMPSLLVFVESNRYASDRFRLVALSIVFPFVFLCCTCNVIWCRPIVHRLTCLSSQSSICVNVWMWIVRQQVRHHWSHHSNANIAHSSLNDPTIPLFTMHCAVTQLLH